MTVPRPVVAPKERARLVNPTKCQKYEDVAKLVEKYPDYPKFTDEYGNTPLAFCTHDVRSVQLLLEHGADPVHENVAGETPIMIARMNLREEAARLMEAKAGQGPMTTWTQIGMHLATAPELRRRPPDYTGP